MTPPVFVSAEEGKNGLSGPAPSRSMLAGAISGLAIAWPLLRPRSEILAVVTTSTRPRDQQSASLPADRPLLTAAAKSWRRRPSTSSGTSPAIVNAMCVGSSQRNRPAAPTNMMATPVNGSGADERPAEPRADRQLDDRRE